MSEWKAEAEKLKQILEKDGPDAVAEYLWQTHRAGLDRPEGVNSFYRIYGMYFGGSEAMLKKFAAKVINELPDGHPAAADIQDFMLAELKGIKETTQREAEDKAFLADPDPNKDWSKYWRKDDKHR